MNYRARNDRGECVRFACCKKSVVIQRMSYSWGELDYIENIGFIVSLQ
jgi:hypothetical protein